FFFFLKTPSLKKYLVFFSLACGFYAAFEAVPYGITFFEKQFTLGKSMSGPDHLASIEPDELKHLCIGVRCVEKSLGSNSKVVTASERKNKIVARKSIIAKTEIKKGEVFSEKKITKK
ncbi:N-acetylneuraminate synthase family protein, partial [Escherichia coli]|uniref:N-acetylneuraminate synthase family protein n=1 Tax=Escherichia coli TaxID=562 RepID=UPI002023F2EE